MKPKSITLYDVAASAGVSYQTVSRVINQSTQVAAATRQKVEAAMQTLHYVPNRVAQQLAGKLSRTIGLATTTLSLHAPSQIASAIKSRASELEFQVTMAMMDASGQSNCQIAINTLLAQRVDGIIVNVPLQDEEALAIQNSCGTVPVIFLDISPTLAHNGVYFDQNMGAGLGAQHLLNLGHQQIALLSGPGNSVSAQLRLHAWQQILQNHGLQPHQILYGDWSARSGYEQTLVMLATTSRPTALLIANDQMALGALRACAEQGLKVPQDISVVGFDDTDDSAFYTPPLTTIQQNFRQLGTVSVEQMIALVDSRTTQMPPVTLPVSLIERQTTAKPGLHQTTPTEISLMLRTLANQISQLKTE